MKRKPIKKQINKIVMIIAAAALVIACAVGLLTMFRIRVISEDSLITQMQQNLKSIVADKADNTALRLDRYAGYVEMSVDMITSLHDHPEDFPSKPVLPPDASYKGIYSMQRYPVDESISIEAIEEELGRLGNLEEIWRTMYEESGEYINTIYIGTESGFLIAYDENADLGVPETGIESYFDFRESDWYLRSKQTPDTFFTDVYPDSYGRGLIVTCAKAFYYDGEYAGVMGMDILVSDLQAAAIDVSLGEGAYAFLLSNRGRVIASPFLTPDITEFDSIFDSDSGISSDLAVKIMSGSTGIARSDDGVYYAYAPVKSAEWTLCIYIPESLVLEDAQSISVSIGNSIIAFIVAFFLVLALVAHVVSNFSKRITKPLFNLREDVAKITDGNLEHEAERINNDEIGDLAESFNGMTASLREYITNLTAVTAEKERIGAELDVATNIQLSMLPRIFPPFPDRKEFEIFASMNPAKEVGGDFYDFYMIDEKHLAFIVADVSGKGVPAALFMVISKTLLKDHTEPGVDLGTVFSEVNNILCESNKEGMFVTAFECVLNIETGELKCVNVGHNPPVVRGRDGEYRFIKAPPGFVLAGMEGIRYREKTMQLEPGDEFFLYTDGVPEATDANNELYGDPRLLSCLNSISYSSCEELCAKLRADVDAFVGEAPQFDDITMLSLRFFGKQ